MEFEEFIKKKKQQLAKAKNDESRAKARAVRLEAELSEPEFAYQRYLKKKAKNDRALGHKVSTKTEKKAPKKENDDGLFI